jgi:4-aminobutyrate aminotransferase / (S)-3-amino-2-methylpropionate transaminase / 5-aminovalerate transaminase
VIMEPIQGEGGFIVPAPGFLKEIVRWCREHGVVFIADEIQTGFARTGRWFASEYEDVEPDIITTAKGIAGGMPLSAVTGRAEIIDAAHPGGLGGTYGGNPVACAAALGSMETIRERSLDQAALRIEKLVRTRLDAAQESDSRIGDIRGRGAMLAFELVDPETKSPDAALTSAVAAAARRAGVITLTCGSYGNVIRLLPPLTISDELLTEGLTVILEALANA